ncbi:Mor transcription activator family protein [Wielerella bovis]|uniref:Mor transcription activator family protein n=1 Tax=Wielerella bovis TaxID=2917790 RepID=UPI002018A175|nr:Mor transcription activator family protein [Wielerella bovis]ULJ61043.1 hypothetical protein MIS44_04095 [Wielerella bovis]
MKLNQQDFEKLLHLLPPSFASVVTIVGAEKGFLLYEKYRGTSFKIGQNKRKQGKVLHFMLAEVVGEDAATRLETALQGQRELYIPKCDALELALRNCAIREQFDELTTQKPYPMLGNVAAKNLARQYDLTERWIWEIVNQTSAIPEPENSQQASLFA